MIILDAMKTVQELLDLHEWPEELLLHGSDFSVIARLFGPDAHGCDGQGVFIRCNGTKIRPKASPRTVDLSAERIFS